MCKLLNAKGEQVKLGYILDSIGTKLIGVSGPSKHRPNGALLLQYNGKKWQSTWPTEWCGLHFSAPTKPTKQEVKAQGNAARLEHLLTCWHYNEANALGTTSGHCGPFFYQLLSMARLADEWEEFKKRYPNLAKQPR